MFLAISAASGGVGKAVTAVIDILGPPHSPKQTQTVSHTDAIKVYGCLQKHRVGQLHQGKIVHPGINMNRRCTNKCRGGTCGEKIACTLALKCESPFGLGTVCGSE